MCIRDRISISSFSYVFYLGLVFWTIGYDTIYACEDTEDDAIIGIKSTARKFGKRVKLGVALCYLISLFFIYNDLYWTLINHIFFDYGQREPLLDRLNVQAYWIKSHAILFIFPFAIHLAWQVFRFKLAKGSNFIRLFKSNVTAAIILIATIVALYALIPHLFEWGYDRLLWPWEESQF